MSELIIPKFTTLKIVLRVLPLQKEELNTRNVVKTDPVHENTSLFIIKIFVCFVLSFYTLLFVPVLYKVFKYNKLYKHRLIKCILRMLN